MTADEAEARALQIFQSHRQLTGAAEAMLALVVELRDRCLMSNGHARHLDDHDFARLQGLVMLATGRNDLAEIAGASAMTTSESEIRSIKERPQEPRSSCGETIGAEVGR